jgi:hypothetical protein
VQGLAVARAGYVIFVTGLDFSALQQGRYVKHRAATRCGWAKEFCVAASYEVEIPVDGKIEGTSFAAPLVASQLANARLLWPAMTSVQTLELARYCARPVQADGSLGAWGTILSEAQADDTLGQGVFSVECLYNENGALFNPITGQGVRGSLGFRGTRSTLILVDPFGRDYALSGNRGGLLLNHLPIKSEDLLFENAGLAGLSLPFVSVGFNIDEKQFLGTRGIGDFAVGNSYNVFLQLSHQLTANNFYLNLFALSIWANMLPDSRSLIRSASGFSHQLSMHAGYSSQSRRLNTVLELTHNFGVAGELRFAGYGSVDLVPRATTQARLKAIFRF